MDTTMMTRRAWMTTTLLTLAAGLMGCKPRGETKTEKPKFKVKVTVRSTKNSNDGRPVRVLVRIVTRKSFVEEDYSAVARLVIEPDTTVQETLTVFPDQKYEVLLCLDEAPKAIAVYGLFTRGKGESWKTLVERPEEIAVWVGESALERVSSSQRRRDALHASRRERPDFCAGSAID